MHSTNLFARFAPAIRAFNGDVHSPALRMASEGRLTVQYAPFEWVNPEAQLIIVGITPGETQAANALREAQRQLSTGASEVVALQAAKRIGAFSGKMRPNLVAMLDEVGLQRCAGVNSSVELFEGSSTFLQTTSIVPYPAFWDGKNYSGQTAPQRSPVLRELVLERFVPIVQSLPHIPILGLGDVVSDTLQWLADKGHLDGSRLLDALPHPSPANNGPIGHFLGRNPHKPRSSRIKTAEIDLAKQRLKAAIAALAKSLAMRRAA